MTAGLLVVAACTGSPPAPPASEHGPAHSTLDAFAHAYRERLGQRGRGCTWQHEGAALRCTDGQRHDLRGLWVLVEQAPAPAERAVELLAMVDQPGLPTTWEQAAPFLLLRVTDQPAGAARPLHPDQPLGLRWALEAGLPGGTVPVSQDQLDAWDASWEQARDAALAHVDAIDPEPFWPLSATAARARVGDGHDPARLASAHAAKLPWTPALAVLAPGHTLVLGSAEARPELLAFLDRWRQESPDAPAWLLRREDRGWLGD